MKRNFSFYKNIILVVASALTLVAVTFAWFSVSYENRAATIESYVSGDGALIDVDFYEQNKENTAEYLPLQGDIALNNFTAGSYNQYQIVVTPKTSDKLNLGFKITDLPIVPEDLASSVRIRYSLHPATVEENVDGTISYTGGSVISQTSGYVPLTDIKDGVIFNSISLANYQEDADAFIIYYEIGLSEDSPSSIGGLKSSLGNIKISAQRVK